MFRSDTVESITASLHNTVAKLQTFAEKQNICSGYHADLASTYAERAEQAHAEALRATNVAKKISALLND